MALILNKQNQAQCIGQPERGKSEEKSGQSGGFTSSPVHGDIFPSSPVHGDLRALLRPVFLFLHFSTIGQANDTPVGDVQRGWLSVAAIQPSATAHRIP